MSEVFSACVHYDVSGLYKPRTGRTGRTGLNLGLQHALAMGKMRNCGMRNAEGKMRNRMCGATVIGRDVIPRDCIYSAFHHTSVCPSVCPSHAGIVSKRQHAARCSLQCRI